MPQLLELGKLTDYFNRLMALSTLLLVAVLPVSSLVFNINLYLLPLVLVRVWRRCWVLLMLPVTCVLSPCFPLYLCALTGFGIRCTRKCADEEQYKLAELYWCQAK